MENFNPDDRPKMDAKRDENEEEDVFKATKTEQDDEETSVQGVH